MSQNIKINLISNINLMFLNNPITSLLKLNRICIVNKIKKEPNLTQNSDGSYFYLFAT